MNQQKIDPLIPDKVLELAVEIQRIPAPTFSEAQRSDFVLSRFFDEGLRDITQDSLGNVFARVEGSNSERPLVVSAHLDTVFDANTDLSHKFTSSKIHAPGIGDNSIAVAAMFGLIWALRSAKITLPSDLWLVANVGEEGLGNLRGMKAVVKHFGSSPRAYLILEGMAYGRIYHRGLGVRRYKIEVETEGGHSWVDYDSPSAIHTMAQLITDLLSIELPEEPRTTLNVGVIEGGFSVNTIASSASIELDLRSTDPTALVEISNRVEKLVKSTEHAGVKYNLTSIGDRPVGELAADHPLVEIAANILKDQGVTPDLNIGSTDANIPLSHGYPAICIGLTDGGGAHTLAEYINIPPLSQGLEQLVRLIQKINAELA
ncbi:MAG: M20/M25/M40 family metallo-hydrolase [Chloroflexota bacterium]